ncbi:MAG: recombination protein O N-terminal domain-containing protein, partial [Bacteroidetes bacterium]|nr:recombination protein O N-terminal domain-containing protein [Bacteroidota bacterium]
MIVETEAVVLHTMDFRDTSKIVTLYSRKFGKIKVIAKGTRNQKTNKFGSSLE